MLQWMGGSRRKVTTSRMSTQKRQKQYFEQRKRQQQQQQQQTFGQDSYSDKPSTCNQHQNKNRSLDVLSLLNLPPIVQEDNSSCPSARRNLEGENWRNESTLSYQNTPCPPTIQRNKVSPVDPIDADPIKVTESRTLSGYKGETVYPKKSSFSYPDIHNKASIGDGDNVNQLKIASNHQLSVLDLLGDDGPNSNNEGNSVHEAHVAFSVEGLGKVETKTPVHSPKPSGRTISYNCSSPSKVTKRAHFSKNLNCRLDDLVPEADAMMQDIDMPFCGNSSELPFYSRGIMDSYSNPKQKIFAVKELLQFDDSDCNLKNTFGDEEVFYNCQDKTEHIWKDSRFLDNNFLDGVECGLYWKNWDWQADSNSADFLDIRNHEKPDFNFESPCIQKKRVFAKATGRFNILDSHVPYSKHQISGNDHDFITPNDTWHSTLRRNGVRDVMNSPPWPSSEKDEERDSWSLLSEESCSSSAVRDQATEKQQFNTMQTQRRKKHSTNQRSPTCKYGLNTNAKQTNYFQREKINGPAKSMRISNPASSIPSATFKKTLDLDDDCLFEERYKTANIINSGFDPFKESASPAYNVWTEDPFGDNAKLFSEGSKGSVGNSFLDNHLHSVEGPIYPNIRSKSKIERQHWEPYHVGSVEDTEFSDILVQKTVSKDGGQNSQISPPVAKNFELREDVCNGSNGLSLENGMQIDASDSENSCSRLKEVNRTPETKESLKTVCYPEHEEETSSSVEIPDKFESVIDGKEGQNGSQNSLPCQPGFKEMEESRAKESSVEDKGISSKNGDTTCQVMMLESYVLQLLCMQQVLKEASTQPTEKKL